MSPQLVHFSALRHNSFIENGQSNWLDIHQQFKGRFAKQKRSLEKNNIIVPGKRFKYKSVETETERVQQRLKSALWGGCLQLWALPTITCTYSPKVQHSVQRHIIVRSSPLFGGNVSL